MTFLPTATPGSAGSSLSVANVPPPSDCPAVPTRGTTITQTVIDGPVTGTQQGMPRTNSSPTIAGNSAAQTMDKWW
jgi:hypothetical protein